MNRKFGKLVDGKLVYAPSMVAHDGRSYINPKEPDYLKADDGPWYPVEPLPPPVEPAPEGYHYLNNAWVFNEELKQFESNYILVENPPPEPRVFSTSKVVRLLTEARLWTPVRDYIVESGYYELFLTTPSFREDDPYFLQGVSVLKTQLQLTDEQIEEILGPAAGGDA